MKTTEFWTGGEVCTAVMTTHLESGEDFEGPISMGYYQGQSSEVWIQFDGKTLNIQCADVDAFCKQLKRAKNQAAAQEAE